MGRNAREAVFDWLKSYAETNDEETDEGQTLEKKIFPTFSIENLLIDIDDDEMLPIYDLTQIIVTSTFVTSTTTSYLSKSHSSDSITCISLHDINTNSIY